MPCWVCRDGHNGHAFMCGERLPEQLTCRDCPCAAEALCDWPLDADGTTCSAPLCSEHATRVGIDIHYCATHAEMWRKAFNGKEWWEEGSGHPDTEGSR